MAEFKTESQKSKQNHKNLKQNHKTQNKITKLKTITKPKTESQNSKQNHKNLKQNRKTQNKITKPTTESQNPKQGFYDSVLSFVILFCSYRPP